MITITKPYLEKCEQFTRLVAKVLLNEKEKHLWYEVDNKYADYLCYEKADSFILAILPYAMVYSLTS